MAILRIIVLVIPIICAQLNLEAQVTYTWNGSVSTEWANPINWTPSSSFPQSIDNVIIGAGNPRYPQLSITTSVSALTMSGGQFDLGGNSLLASNAASIVAGTIQNGSLFVAGNLALQNATIDVRINSTEGTAIITGSTMYQSVNVTATSAVLSNNTFQDSLFIDKIAAGKDVSVGGNIFNGPVTINISSTSPGAVLEWGVVAKDYFNENLVLSSAGGEIALGRVTQSSGGAVLASGKNISANLFNAGTIALTRFEQLGTTPQHMVLGGTGKLVVRDGSKFHGAATFRAPGIIIQGATFYSSANFTKTADTQSQSAGGNIFHGPTSFTLATPGTTGSLELAYLTKDQFHADLSLTSDAAGIKIGRASEALSGAVLSASSKLQLIGFNSGRLALFRFVHASQTPLALVMNGTAEIEFGVGTAFSSELHVNASRIFLNGAVFNHDATFIKTGGNQDISIGGNTFHGNLTLEIDDPSGTGMMDMTRVGNDNVHGNLLLTSNALPFKFGINGNRIVMAGSSNQSLSWNKVPYIKRIEINKSGGEVILLQNMRIESELRFTAGNLALHNAELHLGAAAVVVGAGQDRYIKAHIGGVVKQDMTPVFLTAPYTFPIGTATDFTPFTIQFNSASFSSGAFVKASITSGPEPHLACLTDYVQQFWTLESKNISNLDYSAEYIYADGDLAGNAANMKPTKWDTENGLVESGFVNPSENKLHTSNLQSFGNFGADKSSEPFVSAAFLANESGCASGVISIQAVDLNGAHFWDFGDGFTSNEINLTHSYLETAAQDSFLLMHTVATGCNTDSASQMILVKFSRVEQGAVIGHKLQIRSTVPEHLSVCGLSQPYSSVVFNGSSNTIDSLILNPRMPFGAIYSPGSIVGMSELDIDLANEPLFFLDSLAAGDSVVVQFEVSACCAILNNPNDSIIANSARVDYTGGYDVDDVVQTSNLLTPVFALAQQNVSPALFQGQVGDTFVRTITLTNSGNGGVSEIILTDEHTVAIDITSVSVGSRVTIGETEFIIINSQDLLNLGFVNGILPPMASIVISEHIEIMCGSVTSAPSTLAVDWGCVEEGCNPNNQNAITSVSVDIVPGGGPKLLLVDNFQDNACYDGTTQKNHDLIITNTGTSTAYTPVITLTKNALTFTEIVSGSFSFTDASNQLNPILPDTIIWLDANVQMCGVVTVALVQFSIPDINIGETVKLHWNSTTCSPGAAMCNNSVKRNGLGIEVSFTDLCDPYTRQVTTSTTGPAEEMAMKQTFEGVSDILPGRIETFSHANDVLKLWKGADSKILEVTYSLDAGLFYETNSISLLFPTGSFVAPSQVSIIGPNDGTALTQIVAQFSFPPLPPALASTFRDSEFRINVGSICPAPASAKIGIEVNYLPSATCPSNQIIPLSCQENSVFIHCPNSDRQGIQGLDFILRRINVGQADNDNNGVADVAGSLDETLIKRNRLMVGDTLEGIYHTAVLIDPANEPYPMAFDLRYGYLNLIFSETQILTALDMQVELYDVVQDATYQFTIPQADIISQPNGNFAFDYSIDLLHQKGYVPNSYDKFSNGDLLTFQYKLKVTGNVGILEKVRVDMFNHAYLGAIANPSCDPGTCSPENGMVDVCGIMRPACDTSVRYYYSSWKGNFTLIGYDAAASATYENTAATCTKIYKSKFNFQVYSGPGSNVFPFEYRNWSSMASNQITLPQDFSYVGAQLDIRRTAGTGLQLQEVVSIAPHSMQGSVLEFQTAAKYSNNPAHAVANDALLYLSDESFASSLSLTLETGCSTQENFNFPVTSNMQIDLVENLENDPNIAPQTLLPVTSQLVFTKPALIIDAPITMMDGVEQEVCWRITIGNTGVGANKVWLAPNSNGTILLTNIKDIGTGNNLPQVNGIYQLGAISANQTREFDICATYLCNNNLSTESIVVVAGWSCDQYPTDINNLDCPQDDDLTLMIRPKQAGLLATVNMSGNVQLCIGLPVEIQIHSTAIGTMNDLSVELLIPAATGFSFVPGSAQLSYPIAGPGVPLADPIFVSPSVLRWNVAAIEALIGTNGLLGAGSSIDSSKFAISFNLMAACGFTAGIPIGFKVAGTTNCGEEIVQLFYSSATNISGFPEFTDTDVNLSIQDFESCALTSTLLVQVANTGLMETGANDSIFITLPEHVSMVQNSFVAIQNAPQQGNPNQVINGHSTQLAWRYPAGLTPGSIVEFSIAIQRQDVSKCGPFTLEAVVVATDTAICPGVPECLASVISSYDQKSVGVQIASADFTLPDTICIGDTLILSAFAGSCASHLWDFGDGMTSINANPTHLYAGTPNQFYEITHSLASCQNQVVSKDVFVAACCVPLVDAVIAQDVICFGEANGNAEIVISGQQRAPFVCSWSNGASGQVLSNATAGNYSAVVTDAYGCTESAVAVISEPAALSIASVITQISCAGGTNGEIDLTVSGGTSAYSCNWTDGSIAEDRANLSAGSCGVVVSDANGCQLSEQFVLNEPMSLAISLQPAAATCAGSNVDGAVDMSVSGGTSPYGFLWSNGATTEDLTALCAGSYSVEITDGNGCIATDSTGIEGEVCCSLNVVCKGTVLYLDANGLAIMTSNSIDGGSNSNCNFSLSSSRNQFSCVDLGTNLVFLIGEDAEGNRDSCQAIVEVLDTIAPAVFCPVDIHLSACDSIATWAIFSVDNCDVNPVVSSFPASGSVFAAGSSVEVWCAATDASGNASMCSFTVSRDAALEVDLCSDRQTVAYGYAPYASAQIFPTGIFGGSEPYGISWSNGSTKDSILVSPDTTTMYTITVTDTNGCTASANHIVEVVDVTCGSTKSIKSQKSSKSSKTAKSAKSSKISKSVKSVKSAKSAKSVKSNKSEKLSLGSRYDAGINAADCKVLMCKSSESKTTTRCVKCEDVPSKLEQGWVLGSCNQPLNFTGPCGTPEIVTQSSVRSGSSKRSNKSSKSAKSSKGKTKMLANAVDMESATPEIRVAPNPNNGSFVIEYKRTDAMSKPVVEVCSMLGVIVHQEDMQEGQFTLKIDISRHEQGIYFVRVTENNRTTVARVAYQGN